MVDLTQGANEEGINFNLTKKSSDFISLLNFFL